jgi:Na+-translocating ferredoxin:NAD+ oxidoreductase subunit B
MIENSAYKLLAEKLDALPNGFPPSPDGSELRLLEKLFTPEEALLASNLRLTLETPKQIADRLGGEAVALRSQLKEMARRGLISAGPAEGGLGFGLMPFVVGIYEMQAGRIDAELATLFEQYYQQAFGKMLATQPAVHRVIPINESVKSNLEVRPFESALEIINSNHAWGVVDCICRLQKKLIGQPCEHPIDVCLVLSSIPGAFDHAKGVRALTQEAALATLRRSADAGLVHSVSNNQKDLWYICNCCTCSCGILRGIVEFGVANAVARSSFVNQVDPEKCALCGTCLENCQFAALTLVDSIVVNELRCVGCGLCVQACPEGALSLALRPDEKRPTIPEDNLGWMQERSKNRQIDLQEVI